MKLKDITLKAFSCEAGGCPAVFKTTRETYLVIGTKVDSAENLLSGRIGPNETAIEVPAELMQRIVIK